MASQHYHLIIVGSGPAGLTAGIYAARYRLKTLIIGRKQGGTVSYAHKVCNFPGEPEISGEKLAQKIQNHAHSFGAQIKLEEVVEIQKKEDNFQLITNLENSYQSKTVLLASGTKRRRLGLEDEDKLLGKGVSYCATCDGRFFKDKKVAVIGGSDAACTAALYLSDIASRVYLIYRRNELRCMPSWQKEIKKKDNITVIYKTNITALIGEESLQAVKLDNPYQESGELEVDGLFIEIGSVPNNSIAKKVGVKTAKDGYIKVNQAQKTNIKGTWAAGDITTASDNFKQVVTACAEGAIAARNVYSYLQQHPQL